MADLLAIEYDDRYAEPISISPGGYSIDIANFEFEFAADHRQQFIQQNLAQMTARAAIDRNGFSLPISAAQG